MQYCKTSVQETAEDLGKDKNCFSSFLFQYLGSHPGLYF